MPLLVVSVGYLVIAGIVVLDAGPRDDERYHSLLRRNRIVADKAVQYLWRPAAPVASGSGDPVVQGALFGAEKIYVLVLWGVRIVAAVDFVAMWFMLLTLVNGLDWPPALPW